MRRLLPPLLTLTWSLWFGGLVMLFLAVSSLFKTFPAQTAGQGAAPIFRLFNAYQLTLAALCLTFTFIWRLLVPSKRPTWLFTFFAVATLLACFVTMYLAPHIALLQHQGQTHSDAFKRFHAFSMLTYTAQVAVLFISGLLLPSTRSTKSA
jgi:hypothetical protein